jgi:hypothetical protein
VSAGAAIGIAVVWALFTITLLWVQGRNHSSAQEEWLEERRELLNRIQHPEVMPMAPVSDFKAPERPPDEWTKVGTIEIDFDKLDAEDDLNG